MEPLLRRIALLPLLFLLLVAARARPERQTLAHFPLQKDIFSSSEPKRITTHHIDLDLMVDFATKTLQGKATLQLENLSGTRQLVLDTRGLEISLVTADGVSTPWQLGETTADGRPLVIDITSATRAVTVQYSTRPEADGLFWMQPAQTTGRVSPYLYSQNEPDSARSWIPLQDTPSVRITYNAVVRVPAGMMALMSAENPTSLRADGVYSFRMDQPIPSYLIALAVGRLQFRALDERTGIYAEPELLNTAVNELHYIPDMVDAAEKLLTPYPWKRYDVLLMPPTYIVGGMEHPRLNFLNPAVVTGNLPAQVVPSSLVAHELAHSWAGDLVTLSTWSDVWLNEGITSYLTLRILEEVDGRGRAEHGYFADRSTYESIVASNPTPHTTMLHRPFRTGERPGSAFSSTAYIKGDLFIKTLEDIAGRIELDRFLKLWFEALAFRWADDRMFIRLFEASVLARQPQLRDTVRLEQWIYESGLPANVTAPLTSTLYQSAAAAASSFRGGRNASEFAKVGWRVLDLDLFLRIAIVDVERRMTEVDAAFALSTWTTPPLIWMQASARTGYLPARAAIERVLSRGGPNSWVTSLYENLYYTPASREFARQMYEKYRDRYDPSVQSYVDRLMRAASSQKLAA